MNFWNVGGVIAGFAILAVFASDFLLAVVSVVVAPGILITTLLFSLLSQELVSGHVWISSVIFSVVVGGGIWYFYREGYTRLYVIVIIVIGLLTGFYNSFINPVNRVMNTVNVMYFGGVVTTTVNKDAVITGNNVTLRLSPTQISTVVNTLQENDNVITTKETNEWVYVHVVGTGQEGWVYKQHIKN